jgi:hypothetical protein
VDSQKQSGKTEEIPGAADRGRGAIHLCALRCAGIRKGNAHQREVNSARCQSKVSDKTGWIDERVTVGVYGNSVARTDAMALLTSIRHLESGHNRNACSPAILKVKATVLRGRGS